MDIVTGSILSIIAFIGFVWLLPFLVIGFSSKTSGLEKLGWLLAVVFISWFAWIFFLLFAPLNKNSGYPDRNSR
ncbi:hypothetical protein [Rufibacter sp. LB8]|uniref:hypothetical protein n=1 Tax=Rufibacter sp. LB8 TaxID=2777781 RepID=UPI00178C58AA|nr:hypothetical protein [Rufibacter sp. LB8]